MWVTPGEHRPTCECTAKPPEATPATRAGGGSVAGAGELLGAEGVGQDLGHRADTGGGLQEQRPTAALPEQLTAPPARHDGVAVRTDDGHPDEPAATAGVQRADETALGAQAEAVGRVLDVAADDDAAVVGQPGGADPESAVGRVRPLHDLPRGSAKRRPVDRRVAAHLTYGSPSAAGALTRPTSPATANTVARY